MASSPSAVPTEQLIPLQEEQQNPNLDLQDTETPGNDPLFGRKDLQNSLLAILEEIEMEDYYLRYNQLRECKQRNQFWDGVQHIFWNQDAQDWRVPTQSVIEELGSREDIKYVYDYIVNVYKGHGEAFVAALSADLPSVQFIPGDANNPSDLRAAESADKRAAYIQRYNKGKLQMMYALYLLFNEGFLASYTCHKTDKDLGTIDVPVLSNQEVQGQPQYDCPSCGDQGSVPAEAQPGTPCPNCGQPLTEDDTVPGQLESKPVQTDVVQEKRGYESINIFGLMSVRVPSYALNQDDAGYIVHYLDQHYAMLRDAYPIAAERIGPGGSDDYERYMRSSSVANQTIYQYNPELTTLKKTWIRPWVFNILGKEKLDQIAELKAMFPLGCYFAFINDVFCESRNECFDKYWTITKAGPSKGLHAIAVGKPAVSLQEIKNTLINLFVQTIEYGIPATFANPKVLNFDVWSRSEAGVGFVYPAEPQIPGSDLSNAFHELKTSTLSKEAMDLDEHVDTLMEFCLGTFPSVFGGEGGGSKTLGEYQQSRASALQRLQIPYAYFCDFWGETIEKAVLSSIKNQIADDKFTQKSSAGGFETIWLRKSETSGSFSRLEPEVSASFPMTYVEKSKVLTGLFQMNSPALESVLMTHLNSRFVRDVMGLRDIKIPGEFQRDKQLWEIVQLLNEAPIEVPVPGLDGQGLPEGQMPQPQFQSTVPIEPDVDEDEIHIETLRDFLVSSNGLDQKQYNPPGYANCVAHLAEHIQNAKMQAIMNAPPETMNPGGPPNG